MTVRSTAAAFVMSTRAAAGRICPPRVRWSGLLVASLTVPLWCLFIDPIAPQNGWWWDILMGIGMAAVGMMIGIPIVAPRIWMYSGGAPAALHRVLRLHRDLSYAVIVLVLIHAVGLPIVDTTVIEYLKLSAPASMVAALASVILLVCLLVSSLYRIELNIRYRRWRSWHIAMSLAAMGLMMWHVVDAGYYLNSEIKKALLVALAAGPSLAVFGAAGWHQIHRAEVPSDRTWARHDSYFLPDSRNSSIRLVALLTILFISSIAVFAIPRPDSRAEMLAHPCAEDVCG